jgi:hypothetical protein
MRTFGSTSCQNNIVEKRRVPHRRRSVAHESHRVHMWLPKGSFRLCSPHGLTLIANTVGGSVQRGSIRVRKMPRGESECTYASHKSHQILLRVLHALIQETFLSCATGCVDMLPRTGRPRRIFPPLAKWAWFGPLAAILVSLEPMRRHWARGGTVDRRNICWRYPSFIP